LGIEGNAAALRGLAIAINRALESATDTTPDQLRARATTRTIGIEVQVSGSSKGLALMVHSRDDWESLAEGWAESKRCENCDSLVALLFEEHYIKSHARDAVICSECERAALDG
jgi:hypothetical protein